MKNELQYFKIENSYGGNQEWFSSYMMRLGGCAITTACDCCIYFSLYHDKPDLYPFHNRHLTKADYVHFSEIMKPYLHPRWSGIDTLQIYQEGFAAYCKNIGEHSLSLTPWAGEKRISDTRKTVVRQIDAGYPIPYLVLKHRNPTFRDYVWHWFLLTGYESFEGTFMVKVVTYSTWRWLNLDELWKTGYTRKGGLILFGGEDA